MLSGQEKLTSLKNFINGKKHKSKDSTLKIVFTDGMDIHEVSDVRQIPDYSILESEIFFDSPFIQYEIFIDDKKIKNGFIKEKEILPAMVQRPQQTQISNFDQLTEVLNIKKIMDREVLDAQNKITEARLEAIKSAFESKVENVQNSFLERMTFKDEMYLERLKFNEEKLRLEYKNPRKERNSALGEIALEAIKNISPETKDNFVNLLVGIGQGIAKKYIPEMGTDGLTPVE